VVRVLQIANAAVRLSGELARQRPAAVGGAVVDEEQFPVLEGLRPDARDRLGKKAGGVEEDDDDGNQRTFDDGQSIRPGFDGWAITYQYVGSEWRSGTF
jgi:hypothetical protein